MEDNIPFGYNDDGTPRLGFGTVIGKQDAEKLYEEKIAKERKEWEDNFYAPTPEELHFKLIKEREKRRNE